MTYIKRQEELEHCCRPALLGDVEDVVRLNCVDKWKNIAQRGARTHDPEIKSLMLYRLS